MDRMYLLTTIARIEEEKSVHDQKFAGMEVHAGCLPRFDATIEKLKSELAKLDTSGQTQDSQD